MTTDLARFEARVAHAQHCLPSAAIETLRSAIDLVRGKPFEAANGYEWAFSERLIAHIEATIADAAHQLAQLYLDAGNANKPRGPRREDSSPRPATKSSTETACSPVTSPATPAASSPSWTNCAKSSSHTSPTTTFTPKHSSYTNASATGSEQETSEPVAGGCRASCECVRRLHETAVIAASVSDQHLQLRGLVLPRITISSRFVADVHVGSRSSEHGR